MAQLTSEFIIKQELRPCIVHGKKALFHKWTEKEELFLKSGRFIAHSEAREAKAYFEYFGIIPNGFEATKQKAIYALVEYEDGQIAEVKPSDVRFIDNAHRDYDFKEREAQE